MRNQTRSNRFRGTGWHVGGGRRGVKAAARQSSRRQCIRRHGSQQAWTSPVCPNGSTARSCRSCFVSDGIAPAWLAEQIRKMFSIDADMTPEEQESSPERARRRLQTLWWLRPRGFRQLPQGLCRRAWRRRRNWAAPAVRYQDYRHAQTRLKAARRARRALTVKDGPGSGRSRIAAHLARAASVLADPIDGFRFRNC